MASDTASLLHELIQHSLSQLPEEADASEETVEDLLWAATERIQSSSSAPSAAQDELVVAGLIRRRLAEAGDDEAADRFWHCHQQLVKFEWQPHVRWSLLVLLLRLGSGGGPLDPDGDEAVDELLETYNSKDLLRDPEGPLRSTIRVAHAPFLDQPARYRISETTQVTEVQEVRLVRDCYFAAQGLEGSFVRFARPEDSPGRGDVLCELEGGTVEEQVVRKVAELGWLVKRVQALTEAMGTVADEAEGSGRVQQAFCCSAHRELHAFLKLMAYLESFLNVPIPTPGNGHEQDYHASVSLSYLTLRRLLAWLRPSLQRLRLLAAMAEATTLLRGGALVTAIHGFSQHGDPEVHKFATNILRQVCTPVLDMVKVWLFEGRLDDPCREFFIVRDELLPGVGGVGPTGHHAAGADSSLWVRGYRIDPSMQPPFISNELAEVILKAGKSINFLRECCNDQDWISGRDRAVLEAAAQTLTYGQISSLEQVARQAYGQINRHVMGVLFHKYQLERHCTAIKRYLLLGQGDFIQALMDTIGGDLDRRAVDMSEYSLNASLDAAIRSSNAQYDDADVTDRLRVRLDRPTGVETGWDVFMLQYETDQPLSTVFHKDAVQGYNRVFRLLWSMKRVEHSLNGDWKLMTLIERKLGQLRTTARRHGLALEGQDRVWAELRHIHRVLSEMAHFVTNMQYYLHFEVMEASWEEFCKSLKGVTDLDGLVAVHDGYVGAVLFKALLSDSVLMVGTDPSAASSAGGHHHHHHHSAVAAKTDVQRELQLALRGILDLAGAIKRLNEMIDSVFMEVRSRIHEYEDSYARGQWGGQHEEGDTMAMPAEQLSEVHDVTRRIYSQYTRHQAMFVSLMASQAHVDTSSFIYRMRSTKENLHHAKGATTTISVPSTPRV